MSALVGHVHEKRVVRSSLSSATSRPSSFIGHVGIITADRPETLERGLASGLSHLRKFDRHPELLVIDGSKEPIRRAATHSVVRSLGLHPRPIYVGYSETETLVRRLIDRGFDPAPVRLAVALGTAGCNRNLLVLLTAGRDVMMIDDDICWIPWGAEVCHPLIGLFGHQDPRELTFFRTRSDALRAADKRSIDMLAAHEQLLDRPTVELAREGAELCGACQHQLAHLTSAGSRIVATMFGIAGDSGIYCPYRLLLSPALLRNQFATNPDSVARALNSREVHSISSHFAVTHDTPCMAGCLALSNTITPPPFLPIGRNEDGVFGALLSYFDIYAQFGYVPYGVIHDSDRPAVRDRGPILSASQTRISDVMLLIIASIRRSTLSLSADARRKRLSAVLVDLGSMPPMEFRFNVCRLLKQARTKQLLRVEAVLNDYGGLAHLREPLDLFRETLLTNVSREGFFVPTEMVTKRYMNEPFRTLQAFLYDVGKLISIWPDMWTESKALGTDRLLHCDGTSQ